MSIEELKRELSHLKQEITDTRIYRALAESLKTIENLETKLESEKF